MLKYLAAYLATVIVFVGIDLIWLGYIGRGFYRDRLGGLLLDQPNLAAAFMFYALYGVGVIVFAVQPAFQSGSWMTALLFGALFGFFAYATYDLTNLATLKGWPLSLTLVDLAWGSVLTGISATLGYLIVARLLRLA